LADKISSSDIDRWYSSARAAGALGGKISGAGGGGYLMLVVPPKKQVAVRLALGELVEARVRYEPLGSRVIVAQ
jgi:D-glycero-alpha-D-manno-heptose-7-phosphate kinase